MEEHDYEKMLEDLVWITLPKPSNFLMIKETLTRIGIPSNDKKILTQSVHILHKQNRYALVHFKEMLMLDGKITNFSDEDKGRRNSIANIIVKLGLAEFVDPLKTKTPKAPYDSFRVLSSKEKPEWTLVQKYTFGNNKKVK